MEWQDWLQDVRAIAVEHKSRHLPDIDRVIQMLEDGVVPSPRVLARFRGLFATTPVCARLESDGACAWLRPHGAAHGLIVPPAGQRAICPFLRKTEEGRNNWDWCAGYRRELHADD
jgi:hypothetical protein